MEKPKSILIEKKTKLAEIRKVIDESIEIESEQLLRLQIQKTFKSLSDLEILKANAERQYREWKQFITKNKLPSDQKGKAREYLADGESAEERYQRDILQGFLDNMKLKIKTMNTMLYSLKGDRYDND